MKHIKRMGSLLLIIFVLLTSVGKVYAVSLDFSYMNQAFAIKNYEFEASNQTELYTIIKGKIESFTEKFEVHYTGYTADLEGEITRIIQQVCAPGSYAYGTMSSYEWVSQGYEKDLVIKFTFKYYHTKEQEYKLDSGVDVILDEIIIAGMTDLDKVKAVNDYIVLSTKYSYTNTEGISVHSPYSLLEGNSGVCQAYALLTFKMLEKLGIDVKYVVGEAGESHAWNLVKIDSKWYHLDTTWNDPLPDMEGIISYSYFLMSDAQISKDHTWIREDYPAAIDSKYVHLHIAGRAVTYKEYIYYIDNSEYTIFRTRIDGTGKLKVVDDRSNSFIIYNDKIYYNNYSKGGYLYSVNIDGNRKFEINNEFSIDLVLRDEILYFTLDNSGIKDRLIINDKKLIDEQPTTWARAGVIKAKEYNLINHYLLNNYTSNITRGEFCELVVKIYESISGKAAKLPDSNKFEDTTYSEILKAYELGIVSGISATEFDPKADITREQIALMYGNLLRALDIDPILTAQYIVFADEDSISNWAKGSVQTMYKLGIISGIGDNKINPKGLATREQAINVALRVYEKYKK